jgi:hypothetical protein
MRPTGQCCEEEAHGICAVAVPVFEIPCGAIRLRLLTPYLEIATDRLDSVLNDTQLHVKLLAMQKAYRLQSPAWPLLRRLRQTKLIRRKQFADFIFAFRCGG